MFFFLGRHVARAMQSRNEVAARRHADRRAHPNIPQAAAVEGTGNRRNARRIRAPAGATTRPAGNVQRNANRTVTTQEGSQPRNGAIPRAVRGNRNNNFEETANINDRRELNARQTSHERVLRNRVVHYFGKLLSKSKIIFIDLRIINILININTGETEVGLGLDEQMQDSDDDTDSVISQLYDSDVSSLYESETDSEG